MPEPIIVAAVSDLMLQSRVREQARALGYETIVADTAAALANALENAVLLVLDLQSASISWRDAVAAAQARNVPVLAFGQHTKPDLLRQARDAGCDRAVPRSSMVEDFSSLFEEIARR